MARKWRIEKGFAAYPHNLWTTLCMTQRAGRFAREMRGLQDVWRKNRHPFLFFSNQWLGRETTAKRGLPPTNARAHGRKMTAVHNPRPASSAGNRLSCRGRPIS
jgi:hypothetical protein